LFASAQTDIILPSFFLYFYCGSSALVMRKAKMTKKEKKEKESRYKKLYRGTDRELTPLR